MGDAKISDGMRWGVLEVDLLSQQTARLPEMDEAKDKTTKTVYNPCQERQK
jgi:hypothetical protein